MPIGIATPIVKDGMVFVTSFYDGAMMVKLSDDKLDATEVWRARGRSEQDTEALHSIISTPVWIDDHIFGVDSYGEFRCLEAATGQRVWGRPNRNTQVPLEYDPFRPKCESDLDVQRTGRVDHRLTLTDWLSGNQPVQSYSNQHFNN